MRQDGAPIQNIEEKAPHEAILDLPQERITGDILRGRGPRRGNLETLIKYWRPIMRKPGGFRRCLVILADHPELYPLQRICAWLHHETTGMWPNEGNHHAGGKLGKITRVVKKPRRRKRGKSFEIEAGIDVPIGRVERRLERKAGSVLFAPLDGTPEQIEYKSSRAARIGKAVESVLLPGERGALKPRHLLATALTPGGSGLPGPKIVPRPGRILRGGSSNVRGFRCPPGFERGGHFTDSRFSTCGRQLFGIPGSSRTALRTVAAEANRQPREKVGLVYAEYKAAPTAGVGGGMPKLPDTVGAANPGKQTSMVSKVLKSMSTVSDKTDSPVRRLVREDGSILQPLAPLSVIGKQKNNSDLRNASLLTRINEPGAFGAEELALMQTGLKSIEFSLPGGGSVSLKRTGGIMPPGKARAFGKAIAAASRAGGGSLDYAAILRETAAKTNAVTYSVNLPGETNPGRLVRTDGGDHVPFWVYKTFLMDGAPGKKKGSSSVAIEKAVGKSLKATAVKRLGEATLTTWGPLQYTAALIPDYDEIDRTIGVTFKGSAYSSYRRDISWAFVEEKRASSVWDRGINRFRCPPGTPDAGQITNRMGLGCASAVAKRMLEAFRGVRSDVGEATARANRFRRGDAQQRGRRKPAKPFRDVTAVGPVDIGRSLANRIENVLDGGVTGRGDALGRRRERGERGGLLERIGFVFDVPNDSIESANLAQQKRGRRGDLLRRMGDVFAVDNDSEKPQRLAGLMERIGDVFNIAKIRDRRDPIDLLPGDEMLPETGLVKWRRNAAQAQLNLMNASWRRRMGQQGDLQHGSHRKWLLDNGAELDVGVFDKLESEVLDIEALSDALNGPDTNLVEALGRLSPEVYGIIKQDAIGRRDVFDAFEAARAAQAQRNRDNLGINFPDGFSVDKDALDKLDRYRAATANRRIERHNNQIAAAHERVREGKADKAEVDRLIADMVRQRDKYEASALRDEGNYVNARVAEQYVGNAAIAEAYRRALPGFVDEARRFERLDALKRDKANGLDVLIFNNQAELANVPLSKMPNVNGDEYDNFVIGIGNADNLGELQAIAGEMNEAAREADEAVVGFDILLKDQNLTDKQIVDLARARGEAAWKGEAARRALNGIPARRKELGGGAGFIHANPNREDGNIGEYDVNGLPKIASVPIGNLGLNTEAAAIKHLHDGGDIKDIPDMFLEGAIVGNPTRFENQNLHGGINNITMYRDKKTDRKLFIKLASAGPHEAQAEMMDNQIAGMLGFPVGAMRFGGPPRQVDAGIWVGEGQAIPLVFEHLDVLGTYLGRPKEGDGREREITDVKSFARGMLLDYLIQNDDRHGRNWYLGRDVDGNGVFIPIDHGLAMGGFRALDSRHWDKAPVEGMNQRPGSRIHWGRQANARMAAGDFTAEELAAEMTEAVQYMGTADIDNLVAAIADIGPDKYDNVNKGADWQTQFPGVVNPRLSRLVNLNSAEMLELVKELK